MLDGNREASFGTCEMRVHGMGRTGEMASNIPEESIEEENKLVAPVAVQSSASFLAASWKVF